MLPTGLGTKLFTKVHFQMPATGSAEEMIVNTASL